MQQRRTDTHPWNGTWRKPVPATADTQAADTADEWLDAHRAELVPCPLGPHGLQISLDTCAHRQRSASSKCACATPPTAPFEREGTRHGDEDHYTLKGKRGSLSQKYGRKAADALESASAPAEWTGGAGTANSVRLVGSVGLPFIDRESEAIIHRQEVSATARNCVREITNGRHKLA